MANKFHLKRNQYYELKNVTKLKLIAQQVEGSVFEIGAGSGALTKLLNKPVVSEIDPYHYNKLSKYANIIYGDFSKIDPSELIKYETFVGNLPYRQFKTIFNILENIRAKRIILLIQEEVGLKLIDKKLSRIKILVENNYSIESLGSVSKFDFKPIPRVNGIILLFKLKIESTYDSISLREVVKIFSYNRKTLMRIYKILKWNTTSYRTKRPSELNYIQFTNLFNEYYHNPI
jgi:16S rRNA A1518/A1519 N6-dimethyltransferase RsmA/KsgA/DIM1 with predicted DNA glycosylase/AP lyase activity